MIEIRPATPADIQEFYKANIALTARVMAVDCNSDLVALCGVYRHGNCLIVFSEIRGKHSPLTIWRTSLRLMEWLKSFNKPLFRAAWLHTLWGYLYMGSVAVSALSAVSPIFSFIGGMQEASAYDKQAKMQEEQGRQQQEIYNAQAKYAKDVSERNALIMRDQAAYDTRRLEEQSNQEEAISQRRAAEETRKKNLNISRATAAASAGGGGVLDPTTLNTLTDLEEEGTLNSMAALYEGSSSASMLRDQAKLRTYEGNYQADMETYQGNMDSNMLSYQGQNALYEGKVKAYGSRQAASSARTTAFGNLFSAGSSMASKYAPRESIHWNQGGSSSVRSTGVRFA
jgi:hypothetical protein